jgi:hypothetical protein
LTGKDAATKPNPEIKLKKLMSHDLLFASHITFHCLIGCIIGEVIGLVVGVTLQIHPFATMILSTILAFITGMWLASSAIVKNKQTTYLVAIKTVWIGEVTSISIMEIAMNIVDYFVGGVSAPSIFSGIFWGGLAAAIPVGYLSALPVNYYLIKKNLKKCH